jgi:hypothetical protein
MRAGWRLILRIRLAKAADPSRRGHALLKGCETAIRAAAIFVTVVRAPGIVLSLDPISNADHTDANAQQEQQEPHGRLP